MFSLYYNILFGIVLSVKLNEKLIEGMSSKYVINDPLCKYRSVDMSKTNTPIKIKDRVMDLMNGEHFDDILRDTPNNMRPASIILFYNISTNLCKHEYSSLNFENNVIKHLPSRSFLFVSQYDINEAPKRLWYKFTPERDLVKRFNINSNKCLTLVWIPRKCNGFTDWCINKIENGISYLGCNEFKEQCKDIEYYNTNNFGIIDNNWIKWVNNKIKNQKTFPKIGGPNPNQFFNSMKEQERWIKGRDSVTLTTQLRNAFASPSLPAFTKLGYKSVKIPDDIMNEFIIFYNKNKYKRQNENWESWGQTQVNGHDVSPWLIYMDLDMHFRDAIANEFIKPILEEWVGFELELTSHYGLREYHSGSWLRNHIDRIDVLVISVTLSLFHLTDKNKNNYLTLDNIDQWDNNITWPIEAIDFNGNNIRYNHKPGTMMLYESAKLIHGRPYPLPKNNNGDELIHIGSFCHFTPKDGSWKKHGHALNANKNIARFRSYEKSVKHPSFRPPNGYKGDL